MTNSPCSWHRSMFAEDIVSLTLNKSVHSYKCMDQINGRGELVSHVLFAIHIHLLFLLFGMCTFFLPHAVSGEANFTMDGTGFTVGGFTQPPVAKGLIENSLEKSLYQSCCGLSVVQLLCHVMSYKQLTVTSLPQLVSQ